MREATTRSLDSAIMAPSLNTASSTISSVGKYLRARRPNIRLGRVGLKPSVPHPGQHKPKCPALGLRLIYRTLAGAASARHFGPAAPAVEALRAGRMQAHQSYSTVSKPKVNAMRNVIATVYLE